MEPTSTLMFRFAKRDFPTDADLAKKLLNEVPDVCHAKSYIYRSALSIETYVPRQVKSTDENGLRVEKPIVSIQILSLDEFASRAKLCMIATRTHHVYDSQCSLKLTRSASKNECLGSQSQSCVCSYMLAYKW
jgi:hypothetical protein